MSAHLVPFALLAALVTSACDGTDRVIEPCGRFPMVSINGLPLPWEIGSSLTLAQPGDGPRRGPLPNCVQHVVAGALWLDPITDRFSLEGEESTECDNGTGHTTHGTVNGFYEQRGQKLEFRTPNVVWEPARSFEGEISGDRIFVTLYDRRIAFHVDIELMNRTCMAPEWFNRLLGPGP